MGSLRNPVKKVYFPITHVHRDDVLQQLEKEGTGLENFLTDDMMKEIASRMEDDYANQLFWSSLDTIATSVIEDHGIIYCKVCGKALAKEGSSCCQSCGLPICDDCAELSADGEDFQYCHECKAKLERP